MELARMRFLSIETAPLRQTFNAQMIGLGVQRYGVGGETWGKMGTSQKTQPPKHDRVDTLIPFAVGLFRALHGG